MTKLAYLHEPSVLHNLALRYESNKIYVSFASSFLSIVHLLSANLRADHWILQCMDLYNFIILQTYCGNILIAVNPFQALPYLYDTDMMEKYKGVPFGDLSPHVFAVAEVAYR